MELKDEIEKLTETLKVQRDELKLKIRLGGMEAKEEWDKAEQQWQRFAARARNAGAETRDASGDVGAALKLLGEEVRHAFARVRQRL